MNRFLSVARYLKCYRHLNHEFCCLHMKSQLEPCLFTFTITKTNHLIFTLHRDTKMHGYGVYKLVGTLWIPYLAEHLQFHFFHHFY